jgi:hypothetical protein
MLRTAVLGVIVLAALLSPARVSARPPPPLPPDAPRVLLAFLPGREDSPQTSIMLKRLERRPGLALGLMSATTGRYDATQTLLDIGQGTRTSFNVYKPKETPDTALVPYRGAGYIAGWLDVLRRAESAPEEIQPGLLGSAIPNGAGYVGIIDQPNPAAIPAANVDGFVRGLSLDTRKNIVSRTERMLRNRQFVVVGLPTRRAGGRALDALLVRRAANELIITIRTPPTSGSVLLPVAVAGLGRGNLTSPTSRGDGIVAGIDVLPTVLQHLGRPIPKGVKGQPIEARGSPDADALIAFDERSREVGPRRLPTLEAALLAWLGVMLLFGVIFGPKGLRRGMRVGGLAALWTPTVLLVPATFEPSRQAELAIVAGSALALAILTDLVLRWPRGPMLPAAVCFLAYGIDLALGSELTVRSLLGPNPRFGSRFYGLGNELEATLPVVVLAGLAAVPRLARRSRTGAAAFALAGLALGVVVGSGRLGADVGGVITIGAGFAVATALMLPGRITWRRVAAVALAPLAALALLAIIDVVTGGNSHFTRSVLGAGSVGELVKTLERRYELAYQQLIRSLMPVLTALAILAGVYGVRFYRTLLATVEGTASWSAALTGALAGSVAGALSNDSGPVIIVFGVITSAFVVAYLRGDPRLVPHPTEAEPSAEPGAAAERPTRAQQPVADPLEPVPRA